MLRCLLIALPIVCAQAHAQEVESGSQTLPQVGLTGPTFSSTAVNADRFDATYEFVARIWPSYPLLLNQPESARFDIAICNEDLSRKGSVRFSGSRAWGHLSPGECTMFVDVSNIEFSRPAGEYEWKTRVYLRAHLRPAR